MLIIKLKFLLIWVALFIGSYLSILGLDENEIKVILVSKKYFKSKLTPIIGTNNKYVCKFHREIDFNWFNGLVIIEIIEKDIFFHDELIGSNFDNIFSFKHPDINNPIICFTDLTHRGNGKYGIYVLENNKLNHLFTGTGQHLDWGWSEQYQLKPFLKDKNGDGILDFVLEGEMKMVIHEGDRVGMIYSYEETFLYDKVKGFSVEPQIIYDFEKRIKNAMKMSKGGHQSRNRSYLALFEEIQAKHFTVEQMEKMLDSDDLHTQAVGAKIANRLDPVKYHEKIMKFCHKAIKVPEHEFWYDILVCIQNIKQPHSFEEVLKGDWEK